MIGKSKEQNDLNTDKKFTDLSESSEMKIYKDKEN
jgi:hypothetical protein